MTTDPLKRNAENAEEPIVGSPSHNTPAADASVRRAVETPAELIELVRNRGLSWDAEIVERIDHAIERADGDQDLGTLYIARALALQGRGNASAPAAAVRNAIPHLVAAGAMQSAAFAASMAAVFLDQCGEPVAAMDHAVDALVMLGDTGPTEPQPGLEGVRAALALSGFFMRISAFNLAVDAADRAFQGARHIVGVPIDPLAYSAGYVAVEGAHVADDEQTRERCVAHTMATVDWLEQHGINEVSRVMAARGFRAEIRHVRGRTSCDLELDSAADLYELAAPDLVAWHRLVHGASAQARGDADTAIVRFDEAIPGLEASSDDHCLVRALRGRARAAPTSATSKAPTPTRPISPTGSDVGRSPRSVVSRISSRDEQTWSDRRQNCVASQPASPTTSTPTQPPA